MNGDRRHLRVRTGVRSPCAEAASEQRQAPTWTRREPLLLKETLSYFRRTSPAGGPHHPCLTPLTPLTPQRNTDGAVDDGPVRRLPATQAVTAPITSPQSCRAG